MREDLELDQVSIDRLDEEFLVLGQYNVWEK